MKKRKLALDREIVTSSANIANMDGATLSVLTRKIVESILLSLASLGGVSNVEPPACDCLDTDSCSNGCPPGTDGCQTGTCPPATGSCACHTDQAGGPYC